jgi:hypothetical protein
VYPFPAFVTWISEMPVNDSGTSSNKTVLITPSESKILNSHWENGRL